MIGYIPLSKEQQVKRDNWDARFLKLTKEISTWSKDPSTKCGCVIAGPSHEILSTGYNGLPRGVEYTEERDERPEKYFFYEHAERNAIYNAARIGVSLMGATAYVSGPPCHDCARGLCQSGVGRVVIPMYHNFLDKEKNARWRESCHRAKIMMEEAGVEFEVVDVGVRTD